jgi:hypothetical protein
MFFPKAAAVLLCAVALSEAFSIPDVGYLAVRSPQNFGGGGGGFGGGQNKPNGNNNNAAKPNSGGANTKTSTTAAAAAAASTEAATGANNNNNAAGNNNNNNNNAAAAATTCLKSNAVQTGSADDGNATPTDGQSASAMSVFSSPLSNMTNSSSDVANFINFCSGQTLTNGLQVKTGSCNGIGNPLPFNPPLKKEENI